MNKTVYSNEFDKMRAGYSGIINAYLKKNTLLNTQFVGRPSDETFLMHPYSAADAFTLKKSADRDFIILNFTDPHFADLDVRTWMAIPASHTIRRLVKEIKPDLITVTGDIICSKSGIYSIQRFCKLMESFGIPWAPIFGNHDNETNCDLNFISDLFLKCEHCLFQKGDPEMGWGNYVIHIVEEQQDGKQQIVQALIMMYHKDGYPKEKQLSWFSWASEGIKNLSQGKADVAVMLHIPLPEYQFAYDASFDADKNAWRPGSGAFGEKHETICCERKDGQPVQRGFFDSIKASANITQVLCGHEHLNDFSVVYDGIRLTYLLKVGKGSGGGFGLNGGSILRIGNHGLSSITHRAVNLFRSYDKEHIQIK